MTLQPDPVDEDDAGSLGAPLEPLASADEHVFCRSDRGLTATPIVSAVAPVGNGVEDRRPVVPLALPGAPELGATGVAFAPPPKGHLADLKRRYAFYRTVRRAPENTQVRRRHAVSPYVGTIPARVPGLASMDQLVRTRVFVRDLQVLNDVLSRTACADRYWVWSGLLLGWAREGRVLPHDLRDADFAYAQDDEPQIREGIEALVEAGFRRGFSLRNNSGAITEHTLIRHGARFEFFRMSPVASEWEYHIYGSDQRFPLQLTARLLRQRLEPFDFIGRRWLKPEDHERELSLMYGDWRTPDPSWNYLEQGDIVRREEWTGG